MTAATLDCAVQGRFRLGLGVSGPAGVRGLARRPVHRPARPHPRVRADRPAGAAAPAGDGGRRRISRCRCPTVPASRWCCRCSRCAPQIPVYLAALGPKNLDLTGADRRRLAGHLLRPGHRPPVACGRIRDAARRRRPRPGRHRPVRVRAGVGRRRPAGRPPTRCAGTPRCTSAAWGRAKTNFYHRTASEMGYERRGGPGAGPVPGPRLRRARRPRCRTSSSTGPACSATRPGSRTAIARLAAGGVTSHRRVLLRPRPRRAEDRHADAP